MLSYEKCVQLKKAGFTDLIQLHWVIAITPIDDEDFISIYLEPQDCPFKIKETIPCPSFEELWEQLPEYIHKEIYNHNDNESWILTARKDYFGYFSNSNEDTAAPYQINNIFLLIELDEKKKDKEDYCITEAAADLWLLLKSQNLV